MAVGGVSGPGGLARRAWNSILFVWASALGALVGILANLSILLRWRRAEGAGAFLADRRRVRVFYAFLSKVYDVINPVFYTSSMRSAIVDSAGVGPGSSVLDVGCGTGYTTEEAWRRLGSGTVVGVDLTAQQLGRARKRLGSAGNVAFVIGDAHNLPFRPATFDAVISAGAIEYFPRPGTAIEEAARAAKPGGRVVVAGPERRWFGRTRVHLSLYSPSEEELRGLFQRAGLKGVRTYLVGPDTFFGTASYAVVAVGVR